MPKSDPPDIAQRRRRARWTALIHAVIALGFFVAVIVSAMMKA